MTEMVEPNQDSVVRERMVSMEGNEAIEDSVVRERIEALQNTHSHSVVGEREKGTSSSLIVRERKRGMELESPSVDDCCPICFDNFNTAFKTDCGHWFCGGCILEYWRYSAAALQRCKCPICSKLISKLTPEASLALRQEEEVIEVLKNVQNYNRLYVGGAHGLILKVLHLPPLLIKRFFQGLMDPDSFDRNRTLMQFIALFLSFLYNASNLNFIPIGRSWIHTLFEVGGLALVFILSLVGFYRRRQLRDRARLLAAP